MAHRPAHCVVRGELDNTERGRVTGRIWLCGRSEPLVLDLAGDGWSDVAGARVTFTNPEARDDGTGGALADLQTGRVGDITVSNRRKHFTVPEEEWKEALREGRPDDIPWAWKNAVYIEWYTSANGRVVIESTAYEVEISEHLWTTDADEEAAQKLLNMEVMRDFLDGIIARPEPKPDREGPWSVDDFSEDEWEETLKQSDRLTDAGLEVFDKYQDDPDFQEKEAYLMGWDNLVEQKAARDAPSAEPAGEAWRDDFPDSEGDSETDDDGEADDLDEDGLFQKHPLMIQANDYLLGVMKHFDNLPLDEDQRQSRDTPLDTFLENVMQISGKLAGVLTGWEKHPMPRGMVLATTRRCLNWANEALAALTELESAPPGRSTAADFTPLRPGLFAIRDGITEVRRGLQTE